MNTTRLLQRFLLIVGIIACAELGMYAVQSATTEAPVDHHQTPGLEVSHSLKGNDLHLKLKVTGFTFSVENMGKDNRNGEGHIHLYVDGKKVAKIFDSHYVLKDLPAGHHEVVVELAHNNHDSYGVKRSLHVQVQP